MVPSGPGSAIAEVELLAGECGRKSGYLLNMGKTLIVCTENNALVDTRRIDTVMYLGISINP